MCKNQIRAKQFLVFCVQTLVSGAQNRDTETTTQQDKLVFNTRKKQLEEKQGKQCISDRENLIECDFRACGVLTKFRKIDNSGGKV